MEEKGNGGNAADGVEGKYHICYEVGKHSKRGEVRGREKKR